MKPPVYDPTIPFGLCQCGCGEKTSIIKANCTQRGYVKGQPYSFLVGHSPTCGWQPTKKVANYMATTPDPNPSGLCMCCCCGLVKISSTNDLRYGIVKGHHQRYIKGHRSRVPRPVLPPPPVVSR